MREFHLLTFPIKFLIFISFTAHICFVREFLVLILLFTRDFYEPLFHFDLLIVDIQAVLLLHNIVTKHFRFQSFNLRFCEHQRFSLLLIFMLEFLDSNHYQKIHFVSNLFFLSFTNGIIDWLIQQLNESEVCKVTDLLINLEFSSVVEEVFLQISFISSWSALFSLTILMSSMPTFQFFARSSSYFLLTSI